MTRFKAPADRTDELLQARPAMIADFRADREKGVRLPGIKAFFAPIAELVSAEEGVTSDHIPGREISPPPVR
ncbi:hypothetical protein [Amycolatopsis japonica]